MFTIKQFEELQKDDTFQSMSTRIIYQIDGETKTSSMYLPKIILYLLDKTYYIRCMEIDGYYSIGIDKAYESVEAFEEFIKDYIEKKEIEIDLRSKIDIEKLFISKRFSQDIYIISKYTDISYVLIYKDLLGSTLDSYWKYKSESFLSTRISQFCYSSSSTRLSYPLSITEGISFEEFCKIPYQYRYDKFYLSDATFDISDFSKFTLFDISHIYTYQHPKQGYDYPSLIHIYDKSIKLGSIRIVKKDKDFILSISPYKFTYYIHCPKSHKKSYYHKYCKSCHLTKIYIDQHYTKDDHDKIISFSHSTLSDITISDPHTYISFIDKFTFTFI